MCIYVCDIFFNESSKVNSFMCSLLIKVKTLIYKPIVFASVGAYFGEK